MTLTEKTSRHLNVPYVYLPEQKKFLCKNGVLFSLEEYRKGIDINAEYERREKEDMLYDYAYAKNTGLLRKKRGYAKKQEILSQDVEGIRENATEKTRCDNEDRNTGRNKNSDIQRSIPEAELSRTDKGGRKDILSRRNENILDRQKEKQGLSVMFIVALLGFTSLVSGYISTLHTATYLYDYVDILSAWLMSASVTAYNATAFEVSVLFKNRKRYFLSLIFITLWGMVTLFSMATTVSVFYDRFNFTELQTAQENREVDAGKLSLELLQKKEADLREAVSFKKKDIEYRQEHDYATTAVRNELTKLEAELQENLTEQQNILKAAPEIKDTVTKKKESLFAFLGRIFNMEGGILEFIMSVLSAIFVNIICPFSIVAVTEIKKKAKTLD